MAFTYTAALTTDLERVRLMIGDTEQKLALFQDAEILWFISDNGGNLYLAGAAACRAVAASKSKLAKRLVEGDYERDLGEMVKQWLDLAKMLEAKGSASIAGGTFVTRVDGYSQTVRSGQ